GPFRHDGAGFPMQPTGGPVWCNVAAMSPDGADLHAAERLPDVLATADVTIGHNDGAGGVDDTSGERRHLLVDASADPPQHCKGNYKYSGETDPQLLHEPPLRNQVGLYQPIERGWPCK